MSVHTAQHPTAELRLVQPVARDPLGVTPLGQRVLAGVHEEPQALVDRQRELAPRHVVTGDVDREHRGVDPAVDLEQQDDRQLQVVGAPQLGVVATRRAGTVVVAEESAVELGVGVGTVR
ncbi:MAG: hypothetical protein ACR2KL_02460 [Nocardioidaceae bacterium]